MAAFLRAGNRGKASRPPPRNRVAAQPRRILPNHRCENSCAKRSNHAGLVDRPPERTRFPHGRRNHAAPLIANFVSEKYCGKRDEPSGPPRPENLAGGGDDAMAGELALL